MALDVASGRRLSYRADERFPMCSTFKMLLAAYVLARVDGGHASLDHRIAYTEADLLEYAPTTRAHVAEGGMALGRISASPPSSSATTPPPICS